jgi:hypothetical protein
MKQYFIHNGKSQQGPFDLEQLKAQSINKDTQIWCEGLQSWTSADKIEELKSVLTSIPPEFSIKSITPPPIQNQPLPSSKQRSSIGRRLLMGVGVIVLVLIGIFVFNQIKSQQQQTERLNSVNNEEDIKTQIRNNITSYVTAERNEYTYSNLGGIYNLKITVTNGTDYLIDNVKVKVIYIKGNGDVWNSQIIDFDLLRSQTKTTIKVPDTERGTSIQYEIVSIKSTALGL